MGIATETFRDRKLIRQIDGNWHAQRGFDVIDYTDPNDATSSVGVLVGDPHPMNPDLKCTRVWLADDKLTLAHVMCSYEITSLVSNPENPVLRQPFIRWRSGSCSLPVDTDSYGNPILNAAGDAPSSPMSRNFTVDFLTLIRYEPYFDKTVADFYRNTVNNGSITFQGITYTAGQMYFRSYSPVEDYQNGSTYVKVQYSFEIRTPNTDNLTAMQKRHPFQLRILNQGKRAVYNDSGTHKLGHLYLADGRAATKDVLLDETGVPIDTSIKVTFGGLPALAQTLPSNVKTDIIMAGNVKKAVFLIYQMYYETDFTGIGL